MQSFRGIAPVMQASGRQRWIHFRWACPQFLRQTFHEYAALSVPHSPWAKAFYEKQKGKGKAHHARSAPWPSSGSGFCFVAGYPASHIGTGVHGGARRPRCDRRQCRPSGPQRRLWKTSGLRVEKCRRDFEISAGWSLTDSLRSLARPHTRTQDFG